MVGRQAKFEVLLGILDRGAGGHPGAAVVRGEAGIGKSRLIAELLDTAKTRRTQGPPLIVAVGQCVDLGAIGAPFTPLRPLLRDLARAVGPDTVRAAAGSPIVAAALTTLVPELADTDTLPASPDAPDQIAEAVERVIERLSADHHLLLVIEDLHWADAATLALLKTLALTLRAEHLTLVMTYRNDEVGRDHPLRPVLAELDRSRDIIGITLDRLPAEQIAAQVAEITGRMPDHEQIARIAERSDGVPFLVEELLAVGDGPLPDNLRDLLLARFERLSRGTQDVVGMAAVGGMRVTDDLLAEVAGTDRAELDAALREAIAAQVLVGEEDGYAFRHALIREGVVAQLLAGERLAAHRRYAEVLQRRLDAGDTGAAALVAEHWLAARNDALAFEATVRAYRDAVDRFAPAAAAQFGERVLALWDAASDPVSTTGATRAQFAADVADVLDQVGDNARLRRIVDVALREEGDDAVTTARLLLHSAVYASAMGDYTAARTASMRAESLLRTEKTAEAKRYLALSIAGRMVTPEVKSEDWQQWRELAREALALADEVGDAATRARVLRKVGWCHLVVGELERATEIDEEIERISPPGPVRFIAFVNLTDQLSRAGRYDEAISLGRRGLAECTEWGVERTYGSLVAANLAHALIEAGRPSEGVAYAERAGLLIRAFGVFRSFIVWTIASVELWAGRPQQADAVLERLAYTPDISGEDVDDMLSWAEYHALTALLAAERAPAEEAKRLLSTALDRVAALAAEEAAELPGFRVILLPEAAWALRAASESGVEHDAIEGVRAILEQDAARLADRGAEALFRGLIAAELATIDGADAGARLDLWREAVAVGDQRTSPRVYAHLASYRYAQHLVAAGEREDAAPILERLMTEARDEGAGVVADWAADLAGRAGLATSAASPNGEVSLTPRERQVLELVAAGLTNREIGERLFISPKTASVHVSAILAKVGAANRAEAAAIASRFAADSPVSHA